MWGRARPLTVQKVLSSLCTLHVRCLICLLTEAVDLRACGWVSVLSGNLGFCPWFNPTNGQLHKQEEKQICGAMLQKPPVEGEMDVTVDFDMNSSVTGPLIYLFSEPSLSRVDRRKEQEGAICISISWHSVCLWDWDGDTMGTWMQINHNNKCNLNHQDTLMWFRRDFMQNKADTWKTFTEEGTTAGIQIIAVFFGPY